MQLARQRATALLEMSKRSDAEFKARLEAMAQMWLALALIDEQLCGWAADQTENLAGARQRCDH
jgi:hypothetical protein